MLMDITRAAISQTQAGVGVQPLLVTSGNIIESQLERLISQRFSNVIDSPASIEAPPNSAPVVSPITHQHTENYHKVDTITSTPLRTSHITQPTETVDGPIPSSSISVKTDAIHYRLKGEQRQKYIDKEDSQNNRPEDQSGNISSSMPPPSPIESSPGCAVRRRRPLFVKQSKNCSSTSFNSPTLENINVEIKSPLGSIKMSDSHSEILDASSRSEVFTEEVEKMIESANSSLNASRDEGSILNTSKRNVGFKHPIDKLHDRKSSQEEEFEISAHGQSFS
ncbi:unnamed protein product, partial [Meganyctiphanes norvegica]